MAESGIADMPTESQAYQQYLALPCDNDEKGLQLNSFKFEIGLFQSEI